ncbi:hypothetical protein CLAFUW4_07948 [Fulvia fulva]|uniref:PWWP domain-containing protein n=1 Tax=Passalora fulva TaxID=5499 RepID=A0A9Q8LCY4_PASFU|nr:uncharacterized protein CLAFUR5_08071 [Fulvia fulva]KAK4628848.1 hypothetical protein CLAFUR4_07953 [Fulvia fulva]KAK4630722.1 hypothetical protein CLAFUR0_07950 [Fulvia fulva]UJO15246.1 hypothetical protein CLAFUR5_08071 [Fulvia fulva]WPV13064.1 hypothetical protein CLAFUW4_07948 [Fulvia fulva]WPV27766.1 hypothetical protein CLAFUW7_07949 [Fulvia fulva]
MADETTTTAPVEAPAPAVPVESDKPPETTGTNGEAAAPKPDDETTTEHEKIEEPVANGDNAQDGDADQDESSADLTPASGGKDKKRKSTGGVPEHKSKKGKKNSNRPPPKLHLDCKPGQFYWARLKGYPPWPAVICDESMLPESLLGSRPVSTARPDGSIRDDFKEGGKNAKERTFPIMFLATNEFQWMINTSLTPLEPEECKSLPTTKMTKMLQQAYQIASEGHDIEYFKGILRTWQEEQEAYRLAEEEAEREAERLAEEQAAKLEAGEEAVVEEKPQKKKGPRKSKGGDEDVEVEDAEAPKSSKKRKKDAESDADAPKPKKTPKVTKINAPKTPGSEASAKKSTAKPKKKVVSAPKEDEGENKPQLTQEQKLEQRQKAILYLRHRLQKGFLSRDQAPQESEMASMAEFFSQLESYEDLEPSIIRETKIHKVLKAIVKLAMVPRDEDFNFKKRSTALLEVWNKRMEADGDAAPAAPVVKPETNGEKAADKDASATPAAPAPETKDTEMKDAEPEAKDTEMKDADKPSVETVEAKVGTAEKTADEIEKKVESEKLNATSEPPQPDADKAADAPKNDPVEPASLGNGATDEKDEK